MNTTLSPGSLSPSVKGQCQTTQLAGDERHLDRSAAGHMLLAVENTAGGNEMYGMSGPELLAQLKIRDTLRDAERIHQASTVLKEREAARQALLALKRARFWRGSDTSQP